MIPFNEDITGRPTAAVRLSWAPQSWREIRYRPGENDALTSALRIEVEFLEEPQDGRGGVEIEIHGRETYEAPLAVDLFVQNQDLLASVA